MDSHIVQLGIALAIGLLVGLERGWRERDAPDRSRTAGIRTFGIAGLLGGIMAALAEALNAISVLIAGFLARALVPGDDSMSIVATIVLGMVGSLIGGFLGYLINHDSGSGAFQTSGIIGSVIGAIIALLVYRSTNHAHSH